MNRPNNIIYSLILLFAFAISAIAYSLPPLNQVLIAVVNTMYKLQHNWMSYSNSLFTWLTSGTYLVLIACGLVAPFVALLVVGLQVFKPEWLPKDDPQFEKPLHWWLGFCLFLFGVTLLARLLEYF